MRHRRRLLFRGARFDIYVVESVRSDGTVECEAEEWLKALPPEARKAMLARLVHHKDHGPLLNERHSRDLGDGIYEFKVDSGPGYRLLYFYERGRVTVLTHGVTKRKTLPAAEKRRAMDIRDELRDD